MKTNFNPLVFVALLLLAARTATATGETPFAFELESRSAATNRSKVGEIELVPSCGTGPTRFKVYRTFTLDQWSIYGGSDSSGSWDASFYQNFRRDYGLDGTTTENVFGIISASSTQGTCSLTYTNGVNSGDEGCGVSEANQTIAVFNGGQPDCLDPADIYTPTSLTSTNYCTVSYADVFADYASGNLSTLSAEYTTPMLLDTADLSYPSGWLGGSGAASDITDVTTSNPSIPIRDFSASMQKGQYRFRVKANSGEHFEIQYMVFKKYHDETGTNWVETLKGIGTGGWAYYPPEPIEYLPFYKIVTTDGCEDYVGGTQWLEPLCGSTAGSGGCTQCDSTPGNTTAGLTDYGLSVSSSLGSDSFGDHSGNLILAGTYPTNTLATPNELGISGSLKTLEVFRASGGLRQVKSTQVLADIVTNNSTSYQIRFFTNPGGWNSETGLYEPAGGPFSVTTIEQITSPNHIRVTASNGVVRVSDYEWSSADGGWTLTSGGGIRKETVGWHEPTLTRSNTVRNAANELVSQTTKHYLALTDYGRVVSRQIVGTGSSALTNLWFYYDNAGSDGTNYGNVKLTIEPSGFWKRYQYDHAARLTNEVSQFLNAATNAAESSCRVVRTDYTSLDGTRNCETRIELLQGVEIAREYTVIYPDVTHHIRCATPGASWTNANNLVTQTRYYYGTVELAGKPASVISPDGTLQLYQYEDYGGQRTTTVFSGQPNGDGSAVTNGTKTVSTTAEAGFATARASYDIALGDGYPLDSETYYHDSLGRPTTTYYLDATSTTVNYDCCGADSAVDREGVTTTYLYDPLHRPIGTLRNAISTTNRLDAAGNVLATVRVGRDGTTNLLRRASYDLAGRLVNETNALNGVTTYAQTFDASGQTVMTTTFPDAGQRVETRYQDGSLKSVTGSAAFPAYFDYGTYNNGTWTKETKGSVSGTEWVKTYADLLGRSWKTEYADGAASTNFFTSKGQLDKAVDPDGVTRLYTYNGLGQTDRTILDMNRNGVGTDTVDRITRSTNGVVLYESSYATRRSRVFQTADNGSEILVSERFMIPANNTSISLSYGLGTTNETSYDTYYQQRTVTTTHPDRSQTVSLYTNGLLANITRTASGGSPILTQTDYAYDSHGRQWKMIDARNSATTFTYNAADQVQTLTTPSPNGVLSGLVTTSYYDKSLRATNVVQADSTSTRSDYFANGLLQKTWGSRIYPVEYQYDYAGRMTNMTSWQDFNETTGAGTTGSAATKWLFDTTRGWLNQKKYADNAGPSYTYTAAGRLKSRAWVRGITTWYTNNNAGELWVVNYTDTTPDVVNSYDRRGRMTNTLQGSTSLTKVYNDAGNLLRESYAGGPLSGVGVTNMFDQLLRRTNVTTVGSRSLYGYDEASRLASVSDGTNSATYSFLANSPLVEQITFATNGTTVMTTTKGYDFLNRLTNTVTLDVGLQPLDSHAYAYNSASQRTSVTNVDGSYWVYSYDSMGQVTSGKKYWSDGSTVAGQQFDYTFDDIGNRKTTTRDTRSATYSPNTLNQYTSRTVPGYLNVLGTATNPATVSLWSKESTALYTPTARKGDYFRGEVPFNNSTGAMWLTITNVAVLSNSAAADIVTNIAGKSLLAKTPEPFTYDADGNLTSDSLWTNIWNGENRRVTIESSASLPAAAKVKEQWTHLADGRWMERIVSTNNGTSYYPALTNRYVWDGQILLAVLDHTNGVVLSFLRGWDLSDSIQGAGGVGGVLAVKAGTSAQCGAMVSTTHFTCYDGNGNVTALVNAATGEESARYEDGPFAERIRETGPMAKLNPIRFSTQYHDDYTGDTKYLFRDYQTDTGRWRSRDLIGEIGGINLFAFVLNDGVNGYDIWGLAPEFIFRVTVGKKNGAGGSGPWSQPEGVGSGGLTISATGASSTVTLSNVRTATAGDITTDEDRSCGYACNSVDGGNPEKDTYALTSGVIRGWVQNADPGTYRILLKASISGAATSSRGSLASGTANFNPSGGKTWTKAIYSSHGKITKLSQIAEEKYLEAVVTIAKKGGKQEIILYVPTLTINGCDASVTLTGAISVEKYTFNGKLYNADGTEVPSAPGPPR